MLRLQTELEAALTRNELPEGYAEKFPPFEVFKNAIERINEKIAPRKVVGLDRWEKYEMINDRLNGRVKIGDHWLPVIDGELIERIDGREIMEIEDVRNVGGKLNGWAWVRGSPVRAVRPVINGEFIDEVDGNPIVGCGAIRNVDGKLNGIVKIGERWLPVINGHLIKEINGQEIEECGDIRNVDGKLNGWVRFVSSKRNLPVINGELIEKINGKEIDLFLNVRNVDGKLNGELGDRHGLWLPVIAGEVIEEVGGKRIVWCNNVQNIHGKLNCTVRVSDGHMGKEDSVPVIDGELIEEVDGRKIEKFAGMRNIGGKLYGLLKVDEYEFPVIAGQVVYAKANLLMVGIVRDDRGEFSDAGGRFSEQYVVALSCTW